MKNYKSYIDWIDTQREVMVRRVEQWAAINSGSDNLPGLSRMCAALQDEFAVLGGRSTVLDCNPAARVNATGEVKMLTLGKALQIVKRPEAGVKVFLGGHMDTVFGQDHPFQKPRSLDDRRITGPGVADLKGGLAVMLTALQALERSSFAPHIGWEVLINPDEEIGSPGSAHLLTACAGRNHLGLLFEPTLPGGAMAGARKGSGNFSVMVRGHAAHAGRDFEQGRNAVVTLAEYVTDLYALNGRRAGLTINPAKIEGGGPLNIIPDRAVLGFNVRLSTEEERQWLEEKLAGLDEKYIRRDGITLHRHEHSCRPPKIVDEPTAALMAAISKCGRELGLELTWQATGGCCDGNNLAAAGLPNVDTMGVCGGDIHSDKEYIILDSLTERARLSALFLMRLADGSMRIGI